MLENIVAMAGIIGMIAFVFVCPTIYTRGIYKMDHDELTPGENITSLIPIFNVCNAEMVYTGRISWTAITFLLCAIVTGFRIAAMLLMQGYMLIQYASVISFIAVWVLLYISLMRMVFIVLHDSGCVGIIFTIILTIIMPLGQYYIGTFLYKTIKHYGEMESTF